MRGDGPVLSSDLELQQQLMRVDGDEVAFVHQAMLPPAAAGATWPTTMPQVPLRTGHR